MPYIKKEQRDGIDIGLSTLRRFMDGVNVDQDKKAGILNYCISELLDYIKPANGVWNYDACNTAIGVLECAKLELYRRLVAPYEDTKIKENGDIGTYE